MDEVRIVFLTPAKGAQKEFVIFVNKIKVQWNKVRYRILCVKTSSGKVVEEPFPYLTVYRCWR